MHARLFAEVLMTGIELTNEQRQVLQAERGKPIDVVDPVTQERYVLLARERYERVRDVLEREAGSASANVAPGITPGILRSQQAFWRDLPQLLTQKKLLGKWVCYHGDERIGIGRYEDLIRECNRRGLRDDAYDLGVIEPYARPPWEPEEIEPGGHEVDEPEMFGVAAVPGEPT